MQDGAGVIKNTLLFIFDHPLSTRSRVRHHRYSTTASQKPIGYLSLVVNMVDSKV